MALIPGTSPDPHTQDLFEKQKERQERAEKAAAFSRTALQEHTDTGCTGQAICYYSPNYTDANVICAKCAFCRDME